jgi:hypothetical protein
MMLLGPVLPSYLFFHLDLVHTMPVRRNVARVPTIRGEVPRRRIALVGPRCNPREANEEGVVDVMKIL